MLELQPQSVRSSRTAAYRKPLAKLLAHADVKLVEAADGCARPWDIVVHNPHLYARIMGQGSLGLGEAYMDGWWDCAQLDELFSRVLDAELSKRINTWSDKLFFALGHIRNRQSWKHRNTAGAQHYNRGNDLFEKMLDRRMIYSCGYWQDAQNLDEAQQHKLELVARKLALKPGMQVLDIGCGWGGTAAYIAEHYDVKVTGITLSAQQQAWAQREYCESGARYLLQDYRDLQGSYDRIYSIGMFEHVGFKNYRKYFRTVTDHLTDDGLFLLHTIGHRETSHRVDPWINRYVFPNSILPSAELICAAANPELTIQDWHNFGPDYHTTLMHWDRNCIASWGELPNYDESFQRMWHYYLMCAAGSFKARRNHLWQIVFSKPGYIDPYQAVRSATA